MRAGQMHRVPEGEDQMENSTTPRRLTSDDLLTLKQVSDARMHPTKPLIAYTVAESVSPNTWLAVIQVDDGNQPGSDW